MSVARSLADLIFAYALAKIIVIPFVAILHGEVIGVGVLIAVLATVAGVIGLQMQLEAAEESLRLTAPLDPG